MLLRWGWEGAAPPERTRLAESITSIAGPHGAALCLAYQVIDIVDFSIKHHNPADAPRRLQKARDMLHLAQHALRTAPA